MGKKDSRLKSILTLALRSLTIFSIIKRTTALIKWEAEIAGKSLVVIITLLFLLASLVTFSWLCILTLIFLYIQSLNFSALSAMFIILIINILAIAGLLTMMCSYKKRFLTRMRSL